jgi:hypothetical protein
VVLYEIYREDGRNGITFVHMLYIWLLSNEDTLLSNKLAVFLNKSFDYGVSDSVRHKNVVLLYMYIESIFVLYVTLCLFGGP